MRGERGLASRFICIKMHSNTIMIIFCFMSLVFKEYLNPDSEEWKGFLPFEFFMMLLHHSKFIIQNLRQFMSRVVDHYNNIGQQLVQNNIEYQTSEYLIFGSLKYVRCWEEFVLFCVFIFSLLGWEPCHSIVIIQITLFYGFINWTFDIGEEYI